MGEEVRHDNTTKEIRTTHFYGLSEFELEFEKGARYLLIIHELLVAMGFFPARGCKMRP